MIARVSALRYQGYAGLGGIALAIEPAGGDKPPKRRWLEFVIAELSTQSGRSLQVLTIGDYRRVQILLCYQHVSLFMVVHLCVDGRPFMRETPGFRSSIYAWITSVMPRLMHTRRSSIYAYAH